MKALQPLLQHQLRSLFDAEIQLNVLLPRLIEKSVDQELRKSLVEISGATRQNIQQIQDVCRLLNVTPTGVVCRTMQDLVREAGEATQNAVDTDAALLANAQRIVHYEIASFDLACLIARSMGRRDASTLLAGLTSRAGSRDHLLTRVASSAN